jgi:hypothetical protein
MASTYSALKIELIGTGEQSGTWGATTNLNIGDDALGEAITGTADVSFSSADVTLTLTNTNTTQTARNLRLNLTGTVAAAQNLIVPAIEKQYIVNNGLTYAITVKNSSGTGIAVPAGKSMILFNNGVNVVEAITYTNAVAYPGAGIANSTGTAWGTSYTTSGSGTVVVLATGASVGGTWTAASTWTLPTHLVAGDLTLSGVGYNFSGDFSNATIASRNAFKSSTTNGNTVVGALPNGSATGSAWQAYNAANPTNAGLASVEASTSAVTFASSIRGSGTYVPMILSTGGSTQVTLSTAGNLGIGNTPSGSYKLEVTGKVYATGGFNTRTSSTASGTSLTPNVDNYDMYAYTALAAGLTIAAPTGTPYDGQKLAFRFKDNGSAQTLTWTSTWPIVIGTTLPLTTTAGKIMYVGMIFNGGTSTWDVVAVATQV